MIKTNQAPSFVLAILILFSFGFKLVQINKYPVYGDEALSVLAAEEIVLHGAPILPSGYLYQRSLLYHYLLSIPVAFLGTGEFSIRILSILSSLAVLFGVYLTVSHLANPWGGVLAAALLAFSHMEMDASLSARMYMTFQMFSVFAVYGFVRGFIRDPKNNYRSEDNAYQWLCIFALLGTLLTHSLAVLFLGVMTGYLLVQEKHRIFHNPRIWKAMVLIIPVFYFVFFYRFSNHKPSITTFSWMPESLKMRFLKILKGQYSLNFNFDIFIYYINHGFFKKFPWTLPVFLAGFVWAFWKRERRLIFLYLSIVFSLVMMIFLVHKYPRYLFHLFPVYLSIVCIILTRIWMAMERNLFAKSKNNFSTENQRILLWITRGIGIFFIVSYVCIMVIHRKKAYDFEARRPDEQPAHLFIKERLRPGDIVITSNPWVTYYYLKDFDFFIRQKFYKETGWGAFSVERDEYYGKIIIDSIPELQKIMQNPSYQRIWVIIDRKIFRYTGNKMRAYIFENFHSVYGQSSRNQVIVGLYKRGEL